MSNPIPVAAKTLAEIAMPDFCPRCFWIKLHVRKLPFQIFPGIFNTIDSYTKKIVHGWFDNHGGSPPWLQELGDVIGYKEAPNFRTFFIVDDETNIMLRGNPDDIYLLSDDTHLIIDYKTAKYTGTQDSLMPMYMAQLNAYAFISERCGPKPLTGLALVYMEPITDDMAANEDENRRNSGFAMGFSASVHPIRLDIDMISPLLREARQIYNLNMPPPGRLDCQNCQLVDELTRIVDR